MLCFGVYIIYSQDDIRCVRKDTEKIGTEKRELTTKIHELELFIDNSEKDQKKLRLKKQVNNLIEPGRIRQNSSAKATELLVYLKYFGKFDNAFNYQFLNKQN